MATKKTGQASKAGPKKASSSKTKAPSIFTIDAPRHHEPPVPIPDKYKDCEKVEEAELCCCPGQVHLTGCVEHETISVGAEIDLEQVIALRGFAAASARPINSEGHGRVEHRLTITKPKDCVVSMTSYEIKFAVEGGCPPYEIELHTRGEITSSHACLPQSGAITLSTAKIFDDYASRARGMLEITAFAVDCKRRLSTCVLALPEP